MVELDIRADLNSQDDEGRQWGLLRNATEPATVIPGAVLKAGRGRTWSWVRVVAVDPDGQVHFERISSDEAREARRLPQAG